MQPRSRSVGLLRRRTPLLRAGRCDGWRLVRVRGRGRVRVRVRVRVRARVRARARARVKVRVRVRVSQAALEAAVCSPSTMKGP